MFRNRELRVQLVKKPKSSTNPDQNDRLRMNPYQINEMVEQHVKTVAVLVGVGYVGKKLIDSASEIALIAARANFK